MMLKGDELELDAIAVLKTGYKDYGAGWWCTVVKIVQNTKWWSKGMERGSFTAAEIEGDFTIETLQKAISCVKAEIVRV